MSRDDRCIPPSRRSAVCLIAILFAVVGNVVADDSIEQSAESAAGHTKSSIASAPWYDAESGKIVPIAVEPRVDDSVNRDSRWLPKPKTIAKKANTNTANNNATGNTTTGNGLFGSSVTLGNLFGWVLLGAIVSAIVGAIVYAVARAELSLPDRNAAKNGGPSSKGLPDEQMLERIKHLPPELRRTDVNLRTECERLMHEGRFEQAIILLLGHQLLLLDHNGLLRLSRGKTNGRYVRETRASDQASATWLRATADAFEQSYFGRHEIPAEVFGELWRQNELLESAARSYGESR